MMIGRDSSLAEFYEVNTERMKGKKQNKVLAAEKIISDKIQIFFKGRSMKYILNKAAALIDSWESKKTKT